ncbi:MAG: aspartate dehydrogenase [Acidilobaceae archaeon]
MKKIAIIGCGAIGSTLAKYVFRGFIKAELVALMDIEPERCEKVRFSQKTKICKELECLLEERPEIVVEAASQEAVKTLVPKVLEAGIDVIVLSVGAVLDQSMLNEIESITRRTKAKVYIPSGAIAGLDAIKALSLEKIERVILRTNKSFKSLGLSEKDKDELLYEGPATEAVKLYPANVNVAATLSLAAGREAWVEIWARKDLKMNVHEIEVESNISRLYIRVENTPHSENPKTSYLAVLSVTRLLKQICEGGIIIGT